MSTEKADYKRKQLHRVALFGFATPQYSIVDKWNCYIKILIDRIRYTIQLYSSLKLSLEQNNIKF